MKQEKEERKAEEDLLSAFLERLTNSTYKPLLNSLKNHTLTNFV